MSLPEIVAILQDDSKLNEICQAAFTSVDTDNSGFIDKDELKEVMTSVAKDIGMPEPSDNDVDEVMQELDANGDGKISQDEFRVLIKQVLQLMAGEEGEGEPQVNMLLGGRDNQAGGRGQESAGRGSRGGKRGAHK